MLKAIMKFLNGILVANVVLMVLFITIQVFSRYVLKNPTSWSEEAATYSLVYFTFLGASFAIYNKQNLKIRLIVERLPRKVSLIIDIFTNLISIIFLMVVLCYSIPVYKHLANQLTPALRIPKSLVFLAVPIGSLLILLCLVNEIRELFLEYKKLALKG
jgi:TRAP-type C4-dicarboxylate transport system permease small subunit